MNGERPCNFLQYVTFDPDEEVVGVLYLALLEQVLRSHGCDLKGCRLRCQSVSYEKRISYREVSQILQASLFDAPAGIGFDYGRQLNPIAADTLGQLLMSSTTLLSVIQYVQQFHVLLGLSLSFELQQEGDEAYIRFEQMYRPGMPEFMQWFATESVFSCCVNVATWLTGSKIQLLKLSVPYQRPKHHSRYVQEFGDIVEYKARYHEIRFSRKMLALPILTANEQIQMNKLMHCQRIKSKWESRLCVTERVKMIFAQTYPQFPSLEKLAGHLNMSRSCLYRKLQKKRTSYQSLVNDFRRDESIKLLKESWLSVTDVAEKMGFSDVSSFRRAFKNWTGNQPSSIKRSR